MKVEIYSVEGHIWEGKMQQVPGIDERVLVNNKKHYGNYTVVSVCWDVDHEKVAVKVAPVL